MDWITCESCEEEFRVVCDTVSPVIYCPFCGADIEVDEDTSDYEEE